MKLPRLAAFLLRRFAPPGRLEDVLGDLEEVHRARVVRQGQPVAMLLTTLEAVEIGGASLLLRLRHPRTTPISWIDVKLGLRMLAKYPGLTLIGGLAMAFVIFAGALCFEFYSQVLHPELPFDEGDRVVDISLVDGRTQRGHSRHLYEFELWRSELSTIVDIGAARLLTPNLATGEGSGDPVRAAAMTASGFRVTRVAPLMGRTLGIGDESAGAPDVAVIGYDVWQNRLGADPDVVGRTVRLGGVPHTVVGVMPPRFGFPRSEQLWVPLRFDRAALEPLRGPFVMVFGRLAPGRRIDEARTELDVLMARASIDRPDVYEHLHARVLPYAESFFGDSIEPERIAAMSVNVVAWLFLVLVCGNVALLMFARAAAREGEIVVRTALGASRRRIVSQLFAEALVLGTVAGLVGVGAAAYGLERIALGLMGDGAPAFYFRATLSPRTVAYSAVLVVVTAVMTGAMPGLMITSKKVDRRLRSATAGGGGLRLGGVWTAIIVIQVAATVTFPAIGWFVGSEGARIRSYEPGFATEEFLATGLRLNAPGWPPAVSDSTGRDAFFAQLARTARELTERLEAEPWVKGVTRTAQLPGTSHRWRRIEMDEGGVAARSELDEKGPGRWVYGGVVAPDFFSVLGAGAIQGRTFRQGDANPEARTVVVTEAFVDRVLGGRNPVGRRLRYLGSGEEWDGVAIGDEPGPWYRIVGVVPDLGLSNGSRGDGLPAGFYHAVSNESLRAPTLLVRVNGAARSFASRVREIAAEVEPDLTLVRLRTLEDAKEEELRAYTWGVSLIIAVSAVAVLLSLAGIYAAMSFAVARRTREIGVRVALGAGSTRVLWAIFRRPLAQVGTGLALGLWITAVLSGTMDSAGFWGKPLLVLLGYAALMTSVCLLACAEPVRRALAVEPREALAAE